MIFSFLCSSPACYRPRHMKAASQSPSIPLLQSSVIIIETAVQTLQRLVNVSHTILCITTWDYNNPTNWLQTHLRMCLPGPPLDTCTRMGLHPAGLEKKDKYFHCKMLHPPFPPMTKITFKDYILPKRSRCKDLWKMKLLTRYAEMKSAGPAAALVKGAKRR